VVWVPSCLPIHNVELSPFVLLSTPLIYTWLLNLLPMWKRQTSRFTLHSFHIALCESDELSRTTSGPTSPSVAEMLCKWASCLSIDNSPLTVLIAFQTSQLEEPGCKTLSQ
jgi:hypothetical protein